MISEPSERASESGAEIRLATALKCDVVELTRLWRHLDPSDRLSIELSLKALVADVARRSHSFIHTWEGDGAALLFGYPTSEEDAPETAVRAALMLVEAVRSLKVANVPLEFRVGVSSGSLAIDPSSQSIVGLPFNIAERLKTIAEPGWVVVDDTIRRLSGEFFEWVDLGVRPAKGFEAGLRAWRVIGESRVTSRFQAQRAARALAEVVGRAEEVNELIERWRQASSGVGKTVFLTGEAGIGKSRLARNLVDHAVKDGAGCIEINCTPSARNSPLYPIASALRRLSQVDSAETESEKERLAERFLVDALGPTKADAIMPDFARLLELHRSPDPAGNSASVLREQLLSAVTTLIGGLADKNALLVLCEDCHWADDTTREALALVANQIAQKPAMLLVTARPAAESALGAKLLDASHKEIRLEPLPDWAAIQLVRSLASETLIDHEQLGDIVVRAEGVPLILAELTRSTLEGLSQGEVVGAPTERHGDIPNALRLIVEVRLERWKGYKPIIQAASVLGREFSATLLYELLPAKPSDASGVVSALVAGGWFMVGVPANDQLRFSHAIIRDAVYRTILRDDRREIHSRAADKLKNVRPPTGVALLETLAQHLFEATRFTELAEVRLSAAADAAARAAYVECDGHCEAGLQSLDKIAGTETNRELRFKLLLQRGVALTGRHGYASPVVEDAYRQAKAACGESGEAETLYPVMRGLTALNLVRGNLASGYELSLESRTIADRSARTEFRIDAMSVHCYAALYYRSLAECKSLILDTLKLYEEASGGTLKYPVPNDAKTAAIAILPTVEWLLGNAYEAEEAIAKGLKHVDRPDRDFDKAYFHGWAAGVRYTQRRFAASQEHAAIAAEIGERCGFREWLLTGRLLGLLAEAAQRPSLEALKDAVDVCAGLAAEGVGLNASWYLHGIARGFIVAGDNATAKIFVERAVETGKASSETRMNSDLLMCKAELEADPSVAAELLVRALGVADEQGSVTNSLRAAAALTLRSNELVELREFSQESIRLLDGLAPYPPDRDWIPARLGVLRRSLSKAHGSFLQKP